MFAYPQSNVGSPGNAGAHKKQPRHAWMTQGSRTYRNVHGHRDVCGCGKRLTSQQCRAEGAILSHVAQSVKQQNRSTTRPSAGSTILRDVASSPESGTRSTSRKLASQTSPSSAALSSASSKPINSFTAPSTLKLAVTSSAASHPKVDGDSNADSLEAQQVQDDEEELWNELGEEVPADWDDDQPVRKRTGKPVPPGEYFTVIKGPKKAKSNPTDPPGSGDQLRQQNRTPSKSAADVSRHNLGNHPSAVKRQDSTAANKQLLPATGIGGQMHPAASLNAAASTQLSTATMRSNQPRENIMDSSPRGSRHITNSHSSINQKIRLNPASTSGSPESRTQRLKKLVLTGGQATTFTQNSAAGNQPHKGFSTHSPGSQPPLHLSSHLDKLGQQPGFFSDLLIAGGFFTPDLERHAQTSKESLGVQINQCIVSCKSWQGILNVVRDLAPVMDAVNVATAIHRMAKLFKYSKAPGHLVLKHPLYALLIEVATKLAPVFVARQMANIMWGMATLRDKQSPLLPYLDSRILDMDLSSFVPQELSNVIWAYGTMQYQQNPDFMQRAAQEILSREVSQFEPQAISNICWAFAKHDLVYDEFMEVTGDFVAAHLHTWGSQSIANVVWAYAKMEVCHDHLLAAVATNLTAEVCSRPGAPSHLRVEDFKCQEISNVLLAFARLSTYNTQVLQLVETEMSKPHRIQDSTQQGLVNVMWSFATLRYYPTKYFSAVVPHLEMLLPGFNDQELSNCLWAFGRLAHHPGKLVGVFCECLDHQVRSNPQFSLQAATNSLWSMAVLASAHNSTAMRLVQFLYCHENDYLLETQLHQTFQAVLLARIQAIMAGDKELANRMFMPAKMQARAVKCWKSMMRNSRVSVIQRDVSNVITALQIEHQMEYLAQDGLFSIDIAIVSGDTHIAIEVDGPYHFTLNTHQPLGHTLLRRRLLTAMGWNVMSVPYFDWSRLQSGLDKAHYMARLLTQHGLELPSSDLLQKASGVQIRSSVSMPDDHEIDAHAMRGMRGPFGDSESAEVPPSCHRSQDDRKVSAGISSF